MARRNLLDNFEWIVDPSSSASNIELSIKTIHSRETWLIFNLDRTGRFFRFGRLNPSLGFRLAQDNKIREHKEP